MTYPRGYDDHTLNDIPTRYPPHPSRDFLCPSAPQVPLPCFLLQPLLRSVFPVLIILHLVYSSPLLAFAFTASCLLCLNLSPCISPPTCPCSLRILYYTHTSARDRLKGSLLSPLPSPHSLVSSRFPILLPSQPNLKTTTTNLTNLSIRKPLSSPLLLSSHHPV